MPRFLFASDLHGRVERYRTLFDVVLAERPHAVLLGGDLLPFPATGQLGKRMEPEDFVGGYMLRECLSLSQQLGAQSPRVLLIPGNDDPRSFEGSFLAGADEGAWEFIHARRVDVEGWPVYGYGCVPPTPFQLKDWERYDVSRYVDPGSVSPEEGVRTAAFDARDARNGTIAGDLACLVGDDDVSRAIFLLHSPPYRTVLDRAGLDGQTVDHVPVDVHVGSIAIQRFIEERQPLLTLHGHVHESTRITGEWRLRIGRTHAFTAAHDGPELALVRFDTEDLDAATRELV